jgi:hypothetical protein
LKGCRKITPSAPTPKFTLVARTANSDFSLSPKYGSCVSSTIKKLLPHDVSLLNGILLSAIEFPCDINMFWAIWRLSALLLCLRNTNFSTRQKFIDPRFINLRNNFSKYFKGFNKVADRHGIGIAV